MASGEPDIRIPITGTRDLLDTISHTVNTLAEELLYQKKQADEAQQSMISFLQGISHDMRTPLTMILSCADLMSDAEINDKKRIDLSQKILKNVSTLLDFINDLLDIAKAEANQLKVVKTPVDIRKAIAEAMELVEPLAMAKNIQMAISIDSAVPVIVETSPQRFKQILLNLLGNALKFTPKGKVEMNMKIVKNEIHLDISDTGIGVHPKMHEKIFQPFAQEHSETSRQFGGSGMGLTLSKYLAEVMGWQLLLVRSVPSEGSTFRVVIPMAEH